VISKVRKASLPIVFEAAAAAPAAPLALMPESALVSIGSVAFVQSTVPRRSLGIGRWECN
jgi:hypothetical protein